jgi:Spy/CpxP family protein refolding chaperone
MNTPHNTETRRGRRWTIAVALAVTAAAAAYASAGPALHGHRGHTAMSLDALKAHIQKTIEECAGDASADRKARIASIASAAVDELRPAHDQFRKDHARVHALMMAPVLDRAALEQWRAAQIQSVDAMSRRVLMAAEDAADLLTPEQRASCAGRLGMPMH